MVAVVAFAVAVLGGAGAAQAECDEPSCKSGTDPLVAVLGGMSVVGGVIGLAPATGGVVDVATTAARRGTTALGLAVTGTSTTTPATVVTTRAGMVETAQILTGGAEQNWTFTQAPAGSGDLVLRVTVTVFDAQGALVPPASVTDDAAGATGGVGMHYPGPVDVLYHHGTWIDALGHTWTVTARFVNGAVELTVPANVIAASTFPATLDPRIVVTPIVTG